MSDRLLDPNEVAERVGLSPLTIRRACRAGELVASKLRNRWRIDPADVDAWVARNLHQPTANSPAERAALQPRPRATVPPGGIRAMVREERRAS